VESKGITSELVINDITERDFINYTCKASNVYGYSKYQIQMKPDGELERSCEIKFIFSKLIFLFFIVKGSGLGGYFHLVIVFVFVFIVSSVLVFFIILKFTENPSKKYVSKRKKNNKCKLHIFEV